MADFEIPEEPEYNRNIRRFETTDPAHADLFNAVVQTLIGNDEFLKKVTEQLQQEIEQQHGELTEYTNTKIGQLINGAPETLDTLKEVADAIQENETVVGALDEAVGKKLNKDGDASNTTVTFTSGDSKNPSGYTDVDTIGSGEKQSSLWRKVSLFAKNLRYLWKLCGSNDISGLADGTLTGAVSKLNTDLSGIKNYSANPVAIGKWTDGRTVYRQVYTGTTPTEPVGIISEFDASYILVGNFDKEVIDFTGHILNIGNSKVPVKGFYVDKTDWLGVWHQAGQIRMRTNPNGFLIGRPFVLIVTYVQ